MDVVLQASNGAISDDESAALSILNNADVTVEQKYTYINALQITLMSIKMINDTSLWKLLLKNGVVICSEENIMEYFCATKSLDNNLISVINSCPHILDFTGFNIAYGNEKTEELFDAVIVCSSLENQKYKQILVSLGFTYENFNVPNISDDKLVVLIDENIVKMTPNTLDFIRENYADKVFCFIQKHIDEYIKMMTSYIFSINELMEILSWDIADEIKIDLLEFTNKEISIIGKNYTPEVCLYILNNNFMEDDLSELFSSFDMWDDSIQNKIFTFAIEYIENIINNPNGISENLKKKLICSGSLSKDTNIALFIAMLPTLNEGLIKENLTLLELTDYLKIFDARTRPRFEINTINERLLTAFKENNWIDDYKETSGGYRYYKIKRKKPSNPLPDELL